MKTVLLSFMLLSFAAKADSTKQSCDFSASPLAKIAQQKIVEMVEWSLEGAVSDICDSRSYDVDEGPASSTVQTDCSVVDGKATYTISITSSLADADTGELFQTSVSYSSSDDMSTFEDVTSPAAIVKSTSASDSILLSKEYSYQKSITVQN